MASDLAKQAGKRFPNISFSPLEVLLLDHVSKGKKVVAEDVQFMPNQKARHEDNFVVNSTLLRWLCIDRDAAVNVDPKGILLRGAMIEGALDFEDTTIPFPIDMRSNIDVLRLFCF